MASTTWWPKGKVGSGVHNEGDPFEFFLPQLLPRNWTLRMQLSIERDLQHVFPSTSFICSISK